MGNKGGVGIRLTVGGTKILFVNCHLAAHQNAVKARNGQFKRIEKELSQLIQNQDSDSSHSKSQSSEDGIDFRSVSDRIFFMGDLNYRIRGTRFGFHYEYFFKVILPPFIKTEIWWSN